MSESTLVCITLEERCTGSHGIRLALARRDGSARARTQMCTRQAKQRAGHQVMTASRGRRCARSALMRPTTHRVKVEETSDIGSPREPTDENDLICRLPASYPEASTQTHPTQMGLFACLLSAPKINLICPVSARICADPLHCRPSIEYASASFKEVRTPASPNPLLLTLNISHLLSRPVSMPRRGARGWGSATGPQPIAVRAT